MSGTTVKSFYKLTTFFKSTTFSNIIKKIIIFHQGSSLSYRDLQFSSRDHDITAGIFAFPVGIIHSLPGIIISPEGSLISLMVLTISLRGLIFSLLVF
jgi:hypothetical protein